MSLWNSTDANTSAPQYAPAGGYGVSANGFTLYANTSNTAFVTGMGVGVFGVDATESANTTGEGRKVTHAGWVLRTEGTGGRANRVTYETLVAMGSMTGDGADDTQLPE